MMKYTKLFGALMAVMLLLVTTAILTSHEKVPKQFFSAGSAGGDACDSLLIFYDGDFFDIVSGTIEDGEVTVFFNLVHKNSESMFAFLWRQFRAYAQLITWSLQNADVTNGCSDDDFGCSFTASPGATEVLVNFATFFGTCDLVFTVASSAPPNTPPVLSPVEPQSVREGRLFQILLGASDADDDLLTLNIEPVPPFASFEDNGDGTATLSGTPAQSDIGYSQMLTFSADDGFGPSAITFLLTVVEDLPPEFNPQLPGEIVLTEGRGSFALNIVATDPEDDPIALGSSGLPLSLANLMDNGDGTGEITIDPSTGTRGLYTLTVTATDGNTETAETIIVRILSGPIHPLDHPTETHTDLGLPNQGMSIFGSDIHPAFIEDSVVFETECFQIPLNVTRFTATVHVEEDGVKRMGEGVTPGSGANRVEPLGDGKWWVYPERFRTSEEMCINVAL